MPSPEMVKWSSDHANLEADYRLRRRSGPGQPRRKNVRVRVCTARRRMQVKRIDKLVSVSVDALKLFLKSRGNYDR